jgi:hypothetical protein
MAAYVAALLSYDIFLTTCIVINHSYNILYPGLGLLIGSLEYNRALAGFASPEGSFSFQQLKEDHYPGDVGFDPLGLKPDDAEGFATMQTKELQNGRLAMLGAAGIIAQELVNGEEIFVNLGLATDSFDPSSVPIQF